MLTTVGSSQVKLNLPVQLKRHLKSQAERYGLTVAGYLKHLIVEDIDRREYPVFEASVGVEKAYRKALEEKEAGKVVSGDVGVFLENL